MADGQVFHRANLGFLSALWSVKPDSGEDVVQTLCGTILGSWFPPINSDSGAYKMSIKATFLTDETKPDGAIFEIICIRSGGSSDPSE